MDRAVSLDNVEEDDVEGISAGNAHTGDKHATFGRAPTRVAVRCSVAM